MDTGNQYGPMEALIRALNTYQDTKGIQTRRGLAGRLGISLSEVTAWCHGKKFPAKKFWPRLEASGVSSQVDMGRMFGAWIAWKRAQRGPLVPRLLHDIGRQADRILSEVLKKSPSDWSPDEERQYQTAKAIHLLLSGEAQREAEKERKAEMNDRAQSA